MRRFRPSRSRRIGAIGIAAVALSASATPARILITEAVVSPSGSFEALMWAAQEDGTLEVWARGFENLLGIVQDGEGGAYVTDRAGNAVHYVEPGGTAFGVFAEVWRPNAVAVDVDRTVVVSHPTPPGLTQSIVGLVHPDASGVVVDVWDFLDEFEAEGGGLIRQIRIVPGGPHEGRIAVLIERDAPANGVIALLRRIGPSSVEREDDLVEFIPGRVYSFDFYSDGSFIVSSEAVMGPGAGAGVLRYDPLGDFVEGQEIDAAPGAFLVDLDIDADERVWALRRAPFGSKELLGFRADGEIFLRAPLDPVMAPAGIAAPNELFDSCQTYADLREVLESATMEPAGLLHGLWHKLEQSEAAYEDAKLKKASAALCQLTRKVATLAPRHLSEEDAAAIVCCAVELAEALVLELDCFRGAGSRTSVGRRLSGIECPDGLRP